MILTAVDLELNQPSGKIIQIGACKGNIETGEVISSFSCFVDPQEPLEVLKNDSNKNSK